MVIDHFVESGIPLEEAREWIGFGCVRPGLLSRAGHSGAEGLGAINTAAILHVTLHNGFGVNGKKIGLETGDPRKFKTFDELYDAFKAQDKYIIYRTLWLAEIARNEQQKYLRLPFLSTLGSAVLYG